MCREEITTVLKVSGLFFLLEAILFVFLFISFFHTYEIHLKVLASGFVSLFLTTIIWIIVLLVIYTEEKSHIEKEKEENEEQEELLQV